MNSPRPAPTTATQDLPLTAAQTALVNAQASLGASNLYWTAQCLQLDSTDLPHLGGLLRELLGACEALHLCPELGPEGWLQRLRPGPLELAWVNFREAAAPEDTARLQCRTLLAQPFSLGEPLYHCRVFLLPQATWIYLQVHHLAFDGYSYGLFWQALCARLTNPALPLPAWGMAEAVAQDVALRQSPSHRAQLAQLQARLPPPLSWQQHNPLADLSLPQPLPSLSLPLAAVQQAASRLGLSWPQWLACACAWLLQHYGWLEGRALGLVNMARRGPQARIPMMCMGMQAIACPRADHLADFIERFSAELTAWQGSPQVRWEELAPSGYSHPLGACVNLLLFPQALQLPALQPTLITWAQGPVQQLNLNLSLEGSSLQLAAAIPAHWNSHGATRLLSALQRLLADPAAEIHQPMPNLLMGPKAPEPIDLLGRLWQYKTRTPDAPAYCSQDGVITSYLSLYRQVVSLSAALRQQGVKHGQRVALWAEPGLNSLIALLALGFCRASYLPLDPKSTPARLAAQLQAAGASALLASSAALAELSGPSSSPGDTSSGPGGPSSGPGGQSLLAHAGLKPLDLTALLAAPAAPCQAPPPWAPDQEAYVLFTSGSSGAPKGVCMNWGAYGQFLAAAQQAYQTPLAGRWLQFAALSFDASLEEIGLCLSHGGCLFERPEPCDFASLNAWVRRWEINVLDLPTAYWHQWIDSAPGPLPSLALTIIGGEALCPARKRAFGLLPGLGRLVNSYGPTETCIVACTEDIPAGQPKAHPHASPIGRPLAGMGALLLDDQRQPLPQGSSGELYLFGPQLAAGYLDPAHTAQRFIAPAKAWGLPGLLYASGDLARISPEGRLEFLGRNDDEIKLDGQRIDLLSLTQAHLALEGITQAALWLDRSQTPPRILAAVALQAGHSLAPQTLRQQLSRHWPAQALPARYLLVDQLPLNSRGKTDWTALAAQQPCAVAGKAEPTPLNARGDLQQALAQLWQDCLGTAPSSDADFWQAGGRSLTALVLAQKISRLIAAPFPAHWLYATPGFAALCQRIEQLTPGATAAAPANLCLYPGPQPALAPLNSPSVYACAPIDGGVDVYRPLGEASGLALWGLPSHDLLTSPGAAHPFDNWVARQCQWLLQRPGPCVLIGWSSGGSLALALARALQQAGRPPQAVLLLDTYPPPCWQHYPAPTRRAALLNLIDVPAGFNPAALTEDDLAAWLARPEGSYGGLSEASRAELIDTTLAQMCSYRDWRFKPYSGAVHYLAAALTTGPVPHRTALDGCACGPIHWHSLEACHLELLAAPQIPALAALIRALAQQEQAHAH